MNRYIGSPPAWPNRFRIYTVLRQTDLCALNCYYFTVFNCPRVQLRLFYNVSQYQWVSHAIRTAPSAFRSLSEWNGFHFSCCPRLSSLPTCINNSSYLVPKRSTQAFQPPAESITAEANDFVTKKLCCSWTATSMRFQLQPVSWPWAPRPHFHQGWANSEVCVRNSQWRLGTEPRPGAEPGRKESGPGADDRFWKNAWILRLYWDFQ